MATGAFDPDELAFLAEDLKIKIIPLKPHRHCTLFCGEIPDLEPALPAEVPIWVAVYMRKRRLCRLAVPDWLNAEFLAERKAEEFRSEGGFSKMPECYIEISQILLEHFVEDIAHSVEVRRLLKDIMDLRLSKLRTSLAKNIQDAESKPTEFVNLTEMELNSVRNLWTKGLDQLQMLKEGVQDRPALGQNTQSGTIGGTPLLFRGNVTNITMDAAPRTTTVPAGQGTARSIFSEDNHDAA